MKCEFCQSNYVTSSGFCLKCGNFNRRNNFDNGSKEGRIDFWMRLVDYVFYTPFFDKFFLKRGYLSDYYQPMKEYFKSLFEEKIVGKGEYKGEPFLFFKQNFSISKKESFQLMFFTREKEKRYLTYVTEGLSGGFMIIPEEEPKGTVLVEGPVDAVTLGFIFHMLKIPLRVFSAFGYHRTMAIVQNIWLLLDPLYTFFDKDITPNTRFVNFEKIYEKLQIEDPDDLARIPLDGIKVFEEFVRKYVE